MGIGKGKVELVHLYVECYTWEQLPGWQPIIEKGSWKTTLFLSTLSLQSVITHHPFF